MKTTSKVNSIGTTIKEIKLRPATQDRYDSYALVCTCCHKLPEFCKCPPDAKPTCPVCGEVDGTTEHPLHKDCPRFSTH